MARLSVLGAAFFDLCGLGGPGHAGRSSRAPSLMTERTVRSTTQGEARPAVSRSPSARRGTVPRTAEAARAVCRPQDTEAGRLHATGEGRDDPPDLPPVGKAGRGWTYRREGGARDSAAPRKGAYVVGWGWTSLKGVGCLAARVPRVRGRRARNICSFLTVGEGGGGCQGRCGGGGSSVSRMETLCNSAGGLQQGRAAPASPPPRPHPNPLPAGEQLC